MTFDDFFARANAATASGKPFSPYRYQQRLADEGLPELLAVPTGAGKTAAAVLPHLYRRLEHPDPQVRADTPRRLVVVLPQRTLVEQTFGVVAGWLSNLGLSQIGLHLLMGGASTSDKEWKMNPHEDAVFVGTQDMILSRLLMRGYGESEGGWPISFGLLHADTQFVFDEIQLMGPALPTTLQLDGLRRSLGTVGNTRSMWMSATVHPERLVTVDRPIAPTPMVLDGSDRVGPLAARLDGTRRIHELVVDDGADRAAAVAAAAASNHHPGTRTIVVLNTVKRATEVFQAIGKLAPAAKVVLVHSRFRPDDRASHLAAALDDPGLEGTIVVTTQVLEAGVDMTSRLLLTETAPWSSLTQRAGRCNRMGEHANDEAEFWWIAAPEAKGGSLPYDEEDLAASTATLRLLEGEHLTSTDLQQAGVAEVEPVHPVLRRGDLVDLFDTNPDLSGNIADVGRWVRDGDERTVTVAWRPVTLVEKIPTPEPADRAPGREELCPAPIGDVAKMLAGESARVVVFDQAAGSWRKARVDDVRPGAFLVADAASGGYDPELGWAPSSRASVAPVPTTGPATAGFADDRGSAVGEWVTLEQHLDDALREANALIDQIGPLTGITAEQFTAVAEAAQWHDLGKAHPVFIERLRRTGSPPEADVVYAKSDQAGPRPTRSFRHELASALMLLAHQDLLANSPDPFLVIYLVAAHHGKVRMTVRSSRSDRGGTVLGVEEDSATVETPIPPNGTSLPATPMHLDVIGIGMTGSGPSWQDRASRLLEEIGPFRLAFLEALVRMADWRASSNYGLSQEVEP